MRHIWMTVVFVSVAVVGPSAEAEMYKYRDAQGNVCYTDNLAQIPEDQRPQALTMETVSTDAATVEEKDNTKVAYAGEQVEHQASDEGAVDEGSIAALNDWKKELDEEFSGLMAEKYALLKEKQKLSGLAGRDVEARQAYEGKIADLNSRIADYTTRRDAFQKACDRVKQTLEPTALEIDEKPQREGAEAMAE